MRCREIVDLLPDYSVGLVGGRKRVAIERHVAQCPACAGEYRLLMASVALVRSLPKQDPARPLWPAVRARIEAQRVQEPAGVRSWGQRARRAYRPALAAASVLLAALALWLRGSDAPRLDPAGGVSAEAPYVRAHLQFASDDPLVGSAGAEPLIVLAGREEGRQTR